jgi:hypothetical protein
VSALTASNLFCSELRRLKADAAQRIVSRESGTASGV